jgi:hypothetical protein
MYLVSGSFPKRPTKITLLTDICYSFRLFFSLNSPALTGARLIVSAFALRAVLAWNFVSRFAGYEAARIAWRKIIDLTCALTRAEQAVIAISL